MESELSTLTSELLSRLPTITGEEQRLGLEIYRQLARGEPVSRAELARALEASTDTVEELLGRPNLKSLTYADEGGQIIGFGGLAVREMPHRFKALAERSDLSGRRPQGDRELLQLRLLLPKSGRSCGLDEEPSRHDVHLSVRRLRARPQDG